MSTYNIPFSTYKIKSSLIIPNLQLWDSFQGAQETTVVNEPSVFEPLKVYCIFCLCECYSFLGFKGGMYELIVLVPDYCLSFYPQNEHDCIQKTHC